MSQAASSLPCATCGRQVDAGRAPRVRFSSGKQYFFCSGAHADEFSFEKREAPRLVEAEGQSAPEEHSASRPAQTPPPLTHTLSPSEPDPTLPPEIPPNSELSLDELPFHPLIQAEAPAAAVPDKSSRSSDVPEEEASQRDSLLPLFGESIAEGDSTNFSTFESQLHWIPVVLTAIAAAVTAANDENFWPLVASSLILALSLAWGQASLRAWRKGSTKRTADLKRRLSEPATRLRSGEFQKVHPDQLRPGEEILVGPGQWIPADGTVASGEAQVKLWEGAKSSTNLKIGSRVAAGGQVQSGECTIICSKTGKERAFASLIAPKGARIDERVHPARIARRLTGLVAPLLALLVSLILWFSDGSFGFALGSFASAWGALSHPIARSLPGLMSQKWLTRAARSGISFPHEQLVDHAGQVTAAVFCARGTVLHGQPEVAEVHPLRGATESEVLSLAAGAESVVHHPVASAVLRAADLRQLPIDTCRSHNAYPGSGVVCVSSDGALIVVGSRELLLRERISIAMAEDTLRALESRGLTALMLAKNNHLIGVLALQDSLRAGAKASVQLLLDEGIEPVLISGDSRATTEAVAHALAIEHVKPELAAADRGAVVRSLLETGSSVAVIGTSPRDDAALGAAPVPIVLSGASIRWRDTSKSHERSIGLVGNQVLTAPLALLICRRIRITGTLAWSVSFLPALLGVMSTASRLTPLYTAPLLSGAGAIVAAWLCLRAGPEAKKQKMDLSSL